MQIIIIILILFLLAAAATTLATKIKIPSEIFLLLVSLVIGLFPGMPAIEMKPETLLFIFLPPIIFSAAFFTSWRDFRANKRPISLLAIGLVLFTMCLVAMTMKLLIPALPWAVCFLFGAIVSPTDAASATSLVKKLHIPRRLITVLEGESLINDATALIAHRYALAAILTGTFSLWDASLGFLITAIGGVLLGLFLSYIATHIFSWFSDSKTLSLFTLLLPYFSYLLSIELQVSPIICLVTAGIYISQKFPLITNAEVRNKAQTIWEFYIFILNAFIFILIGLQLPSVIQELESFPVGTLLLYAAIINFIIILLRFIWVYPAAYIPRAMSKKLRARDPMPSWSLLTILSWVGMRGILSLTLALSIPAILPSGASFPYRSLLIVLTYSVIIVTLLLPIFTLPVLVRIFKIKRDGEQRREEAFARIEALKAVLNQLERFSDKNPELQDYVRYLHSRYRDRLEVLKSNLDESPYSSLNTVDQTIRRLSKILITVERKLLIDLRKEGAIHDEVFHRLEAELDLEDLRLKSPRI